MAQGDQLEIEKFVKKSGSSFYWGMKILPIKQARAMFAVYAFCRIVDDIADEIKNKIKREKVDANFLMRWEYIISVMHYPDREGYDFPSEFDLDIGFKK